VKFIYEILIFKKINYKKFSYEGMFVVKELK